MDQLVKAVIDRQVVLSTLEVTLKIGALPQLGNH